MAIDGVEIIDSDLAHDVYNLIMEMYHSGKSAYSIKNEMNKFYTTGCDIDYEIFFTAYILAMWEIGELTTQQLQTLRDIVAKGASSQWNDVHSGAQEARQKALNEFLKKFYQYRQDAYYSFVVTTYKSNIEPTTENILLEEIPVTKRSNTGEFGIRTLDIHYKFIEKQKSHFQKSGILNLDIKAENLGFSRQLNGFDNLQHMEQEMNDILLGEKVELYVCCLF